MRTRRVILPLLALASALSLSLPAAQADKPTDISSGAALKTTTAAFVDDASGDFQIATVACPPGQKVLSGGFRGSDGDFATTNKAADDHTWLVAGEFQTGAKAFAYCSAGLTVEAAQATVAVPAYTPAQGADNIRSSQAKCPRGTRVVSGGWEFSPFAGNSPIYASKPHNRKTWVVSGVYDGGVAFDFTAYAYCMRGVDATTVATTTPLAANGLGSATATCATGRLVGGGFDSTPTPDFYNTTGPDHFHYTASRANRTSWTVSARNYSNFSGGSTTAVARCFSKR